MCCREWLRVANTLVCKTDQSGRARASLGPHDQKARSSACFTTGSSGDHRACSSSNSRLRVRMIPRASLLPSSAIEVRVLVASKLGSSPYELRRSPILRSSRGKSRLFVRSPMRVPILRSKNSPVTIGDRLPVETVQRRIMTARMQVDGPRNHPGRRRSAWRPPLSARVRGRAHGTPAAAP